MGTIEITSTPDLDSVISVANLKAHLRVDHSDEDTLIEAYRDAAIKWVEDYCNTRLGDVTAVMYMDAFYTCAIPVGPVSAISSVTYVDQAGDSQTLNTTYWWADLKRKPARITFDSPPDLYDDTFNAVQVNMTIGYAEADIPTPLIHAVRLMVAHLYESRQAVAYSQSYEVPLGLHSVLSPYRIVG
jgi:uncharacterized phiE125 gp8 family phage protein